MTMVAVVFRPEATIARWASKYCAAAEVLGQDLGASAGDPAHARLLESLRCRGVVELGVVGQVQELGDGERVKFQAVPISLPDGPEQIAVIVERQVRVEASVERCQIAPECEQLVQLGEHLFLAHHVAARLPGQLVEGAVVALRDAHVGIVDDAHHHVGAGVRGMEASADLRGKLAQFGVGGVLPEPERVLGRDALVGGDLFADFVDADD
jgi:hypothetical protein